MTNSLKINKIKEWIFDYCKSNNIENLVIGVSGGIDSAITSTISCMTGLNVHVVKMPLHSNANNTYNSNLHCEWLKKHFNNVKVHEIDLSNVFDIFKSTLDEIDMNNELAYANSKSRLRMVTLYQIAATVGGIVVGTGNKIEDFGVGFFTKYGDGGVDISPIADLYKSEVYEIAKELNIEENIINTPPTDGLWNDNRTDESQIGASYNDLEKCMKYDNKEIITCDMVIYKRFKELHTANKHKMIPIPICKL